jgi:hypothetical protein
MSQIINSAVGYNGMLCECVTNSALICLRRRQVIAGLIASADAEDPTAAAAAEADQAAMYIEVQEFIVGALDGGAVCAQFKTQMVFEPGRCDSLSIKRLNSVNRSYRPRDANIEVTTAFCFVYLLISHLFCSARQCVQTICWETRHPA